jgi:hypothetical protein
MEVGVVTLFVRHKVEDFGKWHRAFLGFADLHARYGASNPGVFRGIDDPNDVTVKQDFASMEAAQQIRLRRRSRQHWLRPASSGRRGSGLSNR